MTLAKVPHGVFIAMTSRITLFAGVQDDVNSAGIYLLKGDCIAFFVILSI